jgi:hypothetical protein
MAKKAKAAATSNGEPGTVASYFKAIFKENPALLVTRSNDEILQRWLKDHPGDKEVPQRIKGNLANIKSVLRKKKRRKKVRPAATASDPTAAVVYAQNAPKASTKGFEQLEEQIDDCLTTARRLDRQALHSVISLLRRARNEVVWKLGQ